MSFESSIQVQAERLIQFNKILDSSAAPEQMLPHLYCSFFVTPGLLECLPFPHRDLIWNIIASIIVNLCPWPGTISQAGHSHELHGPITQTQTVSLKSLRGLCHLEQYLQS